MKKRLAHEIKKHIIYFIIGFAYYIWVVFTGIYIPCVFNLITGLKCPGCGISHMLVSLSRFDISDAFFCNPLLFIAIPVLTAIYIVKKIYYIRNGTKMVDCKVIRYLEYFFLGLTICFWVIRNLPIYNSLFT